MNKKIITDAYKKLELTAEEVEIKKSEEKVQKIEEQIEDGDLSLVETFLPYFYDVDATIARSVQNFFISNKTPRRKLLNIL